MPTYSIDYVPEFDMSRAIYDSKSRFHICYMRRNRPGPAGSLATLLNGAVVAASNSSYTHNYPVQFYPTGEMLLTRAGFSPDNRGRYTFGKYDFTITSTGDELFSNMLPYIELPGSFTSEHAPPYWPKINKATFTKARNGGTSALDVIVDHVHDRLYAYRSNADRDPEIPKEFRQETWCVYTPSPEDQWRVGGDLRLTVPRSSKNMPKEYAAIKDQCDMWFRFQGGDIVKVFQENGYPSMSPYSDAIKQSLTAESVIEQGFEKLNNIDKARVAKNGDIKNQPRLEHRIPWLHFHSRSFFNAHNV